MHGPVHCGIELGNDRLLQRLQRPQFVIQLPEFDLSLNHGAVRRGTRFEPCAGHAFEIRDQPDVFLRHRNGLCQVPVLVVGRLHSVEKGQFSLFVFLAGCRGSLGGGNMFQAWNVGEITESYFGIPSVFTGIVLAIVVGLVIIGGIKSIGAFAGKLVPGMALAYVIAALTVLGLNAEHIGDAFALIFRSALGLEQAAGGVAGYGVLAAIRAGVDRIIRVTDDEVKAAMRHFFHDTHNLVEGAGAAALAALMKDTARKGSRFAVIASGGNIDREAYVEALAMGSDPIG